MRRALGSLGSGSISGFNLKGFTDRWATGGFFPLTEVADGSMPIRGFNFKAVVDGSVARVESAEALLEQRVISLAGVILYFGQALALSGHLAPLAADGTRGEPEASFFIGGALDKPFVSPITMEP